jgi:isobutyryl-CoA mutase
MGEKVEVYRPENPVRVVTATSLFDGHDASINIMRRVLQDTGVEVIHLGHNRSVQEIVDAAIEEDVQGVAVSSYQGGHVEFFKYMVDLLKQRDATHIKVFGGGGGVIIPDEVKELESYGVAKIYSPEDGTRLGLQGIINEMVRLIDFPTSRIGDHFDLDDLNCDNKRLLAKLITIMEQAEDKEKELFEKLKIRLREKGNGKNVSVLGVTGTGGAGKSSLTDEIILRFLHDSPDTHAAIVSCDPSRKKTGGALLGDRIRMNAISNPRIFMRSLATRKSSSEIPDVLPDVILVLKAAGFELIIVETAGIGQGDSRIIDLVDVSLYVMTSEFGAPSQLEKIDMLDFADIVAVNKFEKRGGDDAVRDVRKQVQRNKKAFDGSSEEMLVYGTIASKFNDDGVTALYLAILDMIYQKTKIRFQSNLKKPEGKISTSKTIIIPPERTRYLSEISDTVRKYHQETHAQAEAIRKTWHLEETVKTLVASLEGDTGNLLELFKDEINKANKKIKPETKRLLEDWEKLKTTYKKEELVYKVRDQEFRIPLYTESLSRKHIPKIALPSFTDKGRTYQWLREEHLPGQYPYTAGVFPLRRIDEDPTRMFAGEGDPARTNRRFKMLSANYPAKRLSTAFDSVTLYGWDPDIRPDIYGKVGTSGVSVCTLDDVKILYSGFDLSSPQTSVSMTINGPAPIILAMFLNAAIDQQVDRYELEHQKKPTQDEYEEIKVRVLSCVRGTVQADILKEDQGQNTCIFSIDFALKMMGDIQEHFIEKNVRNFYSVSISGYHIAEAGANPISQLAFTLANGFTYVEYYLSRNMSLDSFGPNLSFFFSNGMDPEYTALGRVARRIWAIAMKERYGGSPRAQMLKYHIQTSGRSLHSQDPQFNDIRTTLQALYAIYDNCNSLHTNAFDEAITTPSYESVRRALAIQLIINREWGLARCENSNQGSFIIEELTSLVEEAVLDEFDRITQRGGVLGAMETGYQRSRIQEESLHYEMLKHNGKLPLIGVNTFRDPNADADDFMQELELSRATEEEKKSQLRRLEEFKKKNKENAPKALKKLQNVALSEGNIFSELMETVRVCSLGQITQALYDVGGKYRRNM